MDDFDQAPSFACTACGSGDLHASLVRSAFWHNERLVVVEGIPAMVCRRCGEQFFDDAAAIGLDLLRGTGFPLVEATATMEVPVFDFAQRSIIRELS